MTVPVDILPDDEFAKAKDLYLYQYAPGTKTLDSQELDVTKQKYDADALQAALALKENARQADLQNTLGQSQLAETTRANNMDYTLGQNKLTNDQAASTTAATSATEKSNSANIKNNFIATIRAGALNHSNYNFKGAFDKANAHGAFDGVSPADMAAILAEIAAQNKARSSNGGLGTQSKQTK